MHDNDKTLNPVPPGRDPAGHTPSDTPTEPLQSPLPGPAPATPNPLPPGLAERYDVLNEAGHGGMGVVYRAQDRETDETIALKVLKPEIAADPSLQERFKNELRLARRITHKNVCRIYDFHRAGATACITMEYVAGESLRKILRRFGALAPHKGSEIAIQICSGLAEAHAQGIIHRDLKPENVMVDEAGDVKIMDFGIARSPESNATVTGQVLGTPAYMAPEQIEGKTVDVRSDIYSLGLILYEMFTGSPAFSGDTPFSVAMKNFREHPTPPRQINAALPAPLEQLILTCLDKDPLRRFQDVNQLQSALEHLLGETLAPTPTPPTAKPAAALPVEQKSLRRRALVWLLPVVVLFLLLVWVNRRRNRSAQPPPSQTAETQTSATQPPASGTTQQQSQPAAPTAASTETPAEEPPSRPPVGPASTPVEQPSSSSRSTTDLPANRLRALSQRARTALRDGRFDEARRALNQILRVDRDNQQARFLLSNLGRIEEVARDPSKKAPLLRDWGEQARKLVEEGKTDEARRLVELMLAVDPSNAQARDALRRLRPNTGRRNP